MTNQPTVPGFVPDDPDLPRPVDSADEADAESGEGRMVIQDTEVIDATGVSADDVANDDPTPPEESSATGDDGVHTSAEGVPVEPIPPVQDPADDPVVAAADEDDAPRRAVETNEQP